MKKNEDGNPVPSDALLGCPFCGHPPERTPGGRIKCANPACPVDVETVRWNTDAATRDWNTRVINNNSDRGES